MDKETKYEYDNADPIKTWNNKKYSRQRLFSLILLNLLPYAFFLLFYFYEGQKYEVKTLSFLDFLPLLMLINLAITQVHYFDDYYDAVFSVNVILDEANINNDYQSKTETRFYHKDKGELRWKEVVWDYNSRSYKPITRWKIGVSNDESALVGIDYNTLEKLIKEVNYRIKKKQNQRENFIGVMIFIHFMIAFSGLS